MWALQNSDNFEDALVLAVNRGHDADKVGAVTGQIAGRIYGYSKIPERWIEGLHGEENFREIAKRLRKQLHRIYLSSLRVFMKWDFSGLFNSLLFRSFLFQIKSSLTN